MAKKLIASEKQQTENLYDKLKTEEVSMIILPKNQYNSKLLEVVKEAANENKSIAYVSVNKPEATLIKNFEEQGINKKKFLIIDCVSKGLKKKDGVSTIYLSSPRDLTRISIAVSEAVDRGVSLVFIDALSTFMLYEKGLSVVRFAHNLINKTRAENAKAILICLKGDVGSKLLDDLSMFVDGVIEL